MSRLASVVLFLCVATAAGCSNPAHYFSLEEFGEGWKLEVEEKGQAFRASWVKGDHRSAKLTNYYDAETGGFIVVNTLYLEIDDTSKVVSGRLKRVATPELSKRAYYERNAKWFRVNSGVCRLNEKGEGNVDVKCEGGYEFRGTVVPADKMEIKKPE